MNRRKNIMAALFLVLTLAAGLVLPGMPVRADSESVPYLALGADLTPEERKTVFSLLNVDSADLDDYNVLYVTNEDEHNYLDDYIASSVIGTRALSCVLIQKRTEGYGLKVTTHNITYCTPSMYVNALSTAGITDSRVVVAGPFPISGTAALVGAMKAYEDMTGEEIPEEYQDAAMNELVVEGAIGESYDEEDDEDDPEIEQFILDLKIEISETEFDEENEREEIEALIRERATERNLELSEELLNQLIELMVKINKLNLDKEQIQQQTEVIKEEPATASTETEGQTTVTTEEKGKETTPAAATTEARKDETSKQATEQKAEQKAEADGQTEGQQADNTEQIIAQGQEQLTAFNEYFKDEDKTLALITSIQDDISRLQAENEDGAEVTEDQKKEIIKQAFINNGIIPAEEVEAGADLSAYDEQIDKTLLLIENIDLFNLDLEGYRQRAAEAASSQENAQSTTAVEPSQTENSDGEDTASTESQDTAEEDGQAGEGEAEEDAAEE